jgi:hypothetical protein
MMTTKKTSGGEFLTTMDEKGLLLLVNLVLHLMLIGFGINLFVCVLLLLNQSRTVVVVMMIMIDERNGGCESGKSVVAKNLSRIAKKIQDCIRPSGSL